MKRLYTIIFAAMAAMLLTVVACDKSDPVKPVEPTDAWIDAELDSEFLSFGEDGEPRSVAYTINGSVPESADVEVSVKGDEGVATCEITPDESGKGGVITFSLTGNSYFSKEVQVVFSNGEKSVSLPLTLIREEFKFADGSVAKKYEFKEYARHFGLAMSKADENIKISIPEGATWIQASMDTYIFEGKKETSVGFKLDDNIGNTKRTAVVTLYKEGCKQVVTVEINQLGSEMEGSLRRGLVALYEATDGDNWTGTTWDPDKQRYIPANENWCSDKPLWEWAGITVSHQGDYYIGTEENGWWLEIKNDAFYRNAGPYEVPEEFWKIISCFYRLNLNNNNLKGIIPDEFWNINFKILNLSLNPELKGTISPKFYEMEQLYTFDIQDTKIGGTLSSEIIKLQNLRTFDIDNCEFEGKVPEELGMLPNLEVIGFENNYFTELPQFTRYRRANILYGWFFDICCSRKSRHG